MLKLKVAILLVLALSAFAIPTLATLNTSPSKLYNVSNSFVNDEDAPSQPQGDPVPGGGFPH